MVKLTFQIYLMLIVWIVSYTKHLYTPVIMLNGKTLENEEVVSLNLSANYTLECRAEYAVYFYKLVPGGDEIFDIDLEYGVSNISYLDFQTASVRDIAIYYCIPSIMSFASVRTIRHAAALDLISQVYIFVNDTENPLAPTANSNLTVWQYSEVIIPCKPSYRPLQVELLWENNSGLDVPYTYNDTIGYTILMINLSLNGLTLICRTRIKQQNFIQKFHLKVRPYRNFVIRPQIRIVSTPSVDGNLILICFVVVPKAINYKMKWNLDKMFRLPNSKGVIEPNMTREMHPASVELEIGVIQLHINFTTIDITFTDVFTFECEIFDDLDKKSSKIIMPLIYEPEVDMNRKETFVMNGQNVTIVCTHYGFPPTTVNAFYTVCNPKHPWECSSEERLEIHTTTRLLYSSLYQETTILFKPSGPGVVRCEAHNDFGNNSAETKVWIDNLDEDFVIFETNIKNQIMAGDNVTLTCAAKSRLFESLQWHRNGGLVSSGNGVQIIPLNTTYSLRTKIHFYNITIDQSGTYECRVENETGVFNKSVEILVEEYEKPKITETNLRGPNMVRNVGESLELRCNFSGKPTPNITWLKDGAELAAKTGSKSINIRAITADDFGTYECVVKNKIGQAAEMVNIVTGFQLDLTLGMIALIAVLVACIFYLIIRERNLRKNLKTAGLDNFELGVIDRINPDLPLDEQADFLPYDRKFEFPKDKLKLGRQLGSGAFGVVLQAIAIHLHPEEEETVVAVKVVSKMANNAIMKALVSELKIMANLGRHMNIVNLLGAVTNNIAKRDLMIILEYCPFGNLQDHLQKNRRNFVDQINPETKHFILEITGVQESQAPHYENTTAMDLVLNYFNPEPEGESKISTTNLIAWAFQIARGMEYLASRRVLHGDLAARNVLLCEQNIVKVCDFGLARSLYRKSVYKKKGSPLLPVRWLAPESIGDKVFGTFSDVWSFGIVLWELFSLATSPYPGMELNEEWFMRIRDGYRMSKPEHANDSIYNIMLHCWELQPQSRPSFNELQNVLGSMLPNYVVRHFIGLNGTYIEWNTAKQTDYGTLKEE